MSEAYVVIWNGRNDGQDGDLLRPVDWTSPKSPDVPLNLSKRAHRPLSASTRRTQRRRLLAKEYARMQEALR